MPQLATDTVLMRRGRPAKGASRTSKVKSVRLPEALWKEMERAARAKRLNVHQAMRAALLSDGCAARGDPSQSNDLSRGRVFVAAIDRFFQADSLHFRDSVPSLHQAKGISAPNATKRPDESSSPSMTTILAWS